MKKYRVLIEVEIDLTKYPWIDLNEIDNSGELEIYDSEEDEKYSYKISVEMFDPDCGETFCYGEIKKIEVS